MGYANSKQYSCILPELNIDGYHHRGTLLAIIYDNNELKDDIDNITYHKSEWYKIATK